MTVFIVPNNLGLHRFGVTASKKLSTKAHDRNRAKRLIRETFRLSKNILSCGDQAFDWVINARRELLKKKTPDAMVEFADIVRRATDFGEGI